MILLTVLLTLAGFGLGALLGYRQGFIAAVNRMNEAIEDFEQRRLQTNAQQMENYAHQDTSVARYLERSEGHIDDIFRHPHSSHETK